MQDLNTPLGQNRKAPAKATETRDPATRRGWRLAAIFAAMLIAWNAYGLAAGDPDPQTVVLTLPEPETAVAAVQPAEPQAPAEQTPEPEVDVVYGDENIEAARSGEVPLPSPAERETETRLSPNGPKVIVVTDPTAVEIGQPEGTAHLPELAAIENTDMGPLPIRTEDGRRPSDIYARPSSAGTGKRIALVIGGLGLSQTGTQNAIKNLPPEITLAFAPTGNSLNRWMQDARRAGHELLVQVPMEPFNYPAVNPGPATLRLASSSETNIENLHWALGRLTNYTGVMNYLGARFAADEAAMTPVLEDLSKRGLLYFNDGTAGGERLAQLAMQKGVPYASGNVIIDESRDPEAIRAKLKALEDLAAARGEAIGTGSALDLTVEVVAEWANAAKKRGYEIVGISTLAREAN